MTPIEYALIALFVPLAAAFIIAVVAPLRHAGMPAALLSVAAALVSLGASLVLLVQQLAQPDRVIHEVVRWLPNGPDSLAQVGVHLDGISVSMSVVVTLVAACVQIFSLGYMADEPPAARGRYFGYHSFFIFTMLLLVIAPNLLQLFAGWELVGLTSYLLIGFYFQKPSAAKASVKAIWVTKFADIGLLLGLICLFAVTGGFEWTATLSGGWATAITLLIFLAVVGKSAQFPLHIWLPNAMEGPTPVSALLHAATMVAAGVYLLVRAEPLFVQAPNTLMVMAWLGGFTALFAAVLATVQTDIKRVLAYSTCSQLGYMVCALGAGASMAGYFHLTTHAFFKALLFLAAGSMIHAVHSNEMSSMGGLMRRMKTTSAVFIVGALALAGIPGLAGFFSKDLILEAVHEADLFVPWAMLIAAAFLTAFYMGRVVFLTIFGPFSEASEGAHESGFSMTGPLLLLAAGAIGIGYFGSEFASLSGGSYHFHVGMSGMLGTACALAGLLLSWLIYGSHRLSPQAFSFLAPIGRLARSGLVDRFFEFAYRRGALAFADAVGFFDRYVIDGVMNWIGWSTIMSGRRLRKTQTGNVRDYVYAVVAGAVVIVFWGALAVSGLLLSSVVAAPFIAAVILLFVPERNRLTVRFVSLLGAGYSLLASCLVALRYDIAAGGFQMSEIHALVPRFGIAIRFAVDGWGVSLLLLTGLVIVAGVLASWTLDDRSKNFFITLLVLVTGVFGVFVSQDLFVFFLFYEIAVLPMYLLIGIWGSSHAVTEAGPFKYVWRLFDIGGREYAAMKLTLMLLVGSAFIIAVMLAMYLATGAGSFDMQVLGSYDYDRSLQMWCFPLCWLGFGALAGVFPFHTWSPDGHASAPTAVSMLHAGVLMKLGAFGIMRVGFMMLPEGAVSWAPLVGCVAVVNIVYGALSAMSQRDLKYVVAYSSVSHMGVVMLGAATLTVEGWNGAVFQMFAHGLMTGLFFALVGLVYGASHTRHMPSMGGFGLRMPGVATFFTLACLSSLGLPGTAGFVAEILVFIGAWKSLHPWWAIPGILGAFITAVYVLRASRRIFWGEGPAEEFHDLKDAKGVEWGALVILGGCIVLFGFMPSLILDFINRVTPDYLAVLTQLMESR